jgi:hypothetical protein
MLPCEAKAVPSTANTSGACVSQIHGVLFIALHRCGAHQACPHDRYHRSPRLCYLNERADSLRHEAGGVGENGRCGSPLNTSRIVK